jgi:hypothetical protein
MFAHVPRLNSDGKRGFVSLRARVRRPFRGVARNDVRPNATELVFLGVLCVCLGVLSGKVFFPSMEKA